MAEIKIPAENRTEFGKGAARRIRRAAKVPAVLYGHGSDPLHITLPGHELMLALKQANVLLSIDIEGGESQLAIAKQVQRDPLKGFIEHVDLLLVKSGEKVTVDVPIVHVGEPGPDTLVVTEAVSIALEVEATHIPAEVELSLAGIEAGTQIHARDLVLPAGAALGVDEDTLIVNVSAAPTAAQLEADTGGTAEAEAPVEAEEAAQE